MIAALIWGAGLAAAIAIGTLIPHARWVAADRQRGTWITWLVILPPVGAVLFLFFVLPALLGAASLPMARATGLASGPLFRD